MLPMVVVVPSLSHRPVAQVACSVGVVAELRVSLGSVIVVVGGGKVGGGTVGGGREGGGREGRRTDGGFVVRCRLLL